MTLRDITTTNLPQLVSGVNDVVDFLSFYVESVPGRSGILSPITAGGARRRR